jgi:ornithine cyclodeaminase
VVVLFDGESGHPVCIADAEAITTIRTAAATTVATEALARPDAKTLAIFGYGTQADAHVTALTSVRKYERIVVWGRSMDRAGEFARRHSEIAGLPVEAASSAEAAARESDVICTVTNATTPILLGRWVRPGTHVNAVGSSFAGPVEVDSDLVVASRYIADSRRSALAQAAEFLNAKAAGLVHDDHVVAEIGEVLAHLAPGRVSASDITLYKSLGHIVQDLAAARYLYA